MDKIFIVRIHDMRLANGAFAYICCKKDQLIVKETASSKNAVKRKHENDDVDGAELTKKHRGRKLATSSTVESKRDMYALDVFG